jgi:4-amino-4-deoxy-L-arabinose transferase-like glycosyltransferase
MISPGLVEASSVALSELAFIAALLASIALLVAERGTSLVLLGGILLGFASLTRYVGIFFLPFIAALAFVCQRRVSSSWSATIRLALFLTAAVVFPAFWIRRNIRLTGSATGNREPGGGTLIDATRSAVEALGQLVVGGRFSPGIQFTVGAILTVALLIVAGLILFQRRFELLLFASIPLAYMVFTAYRYVHVEYAPIDLRAMTPTAPFLVIALASAPWPRVTRTRPANWAAWPAVSLLLLLGVLDIGARAMEAEAWGSDKFQNSNFAQFVAKLPEGSVFISNFPQRAFSLTQSLPIRNQYQFDLPQVNTCDRRFGLFFREAPLQGNEPELASAIYSDDEGTVFDLGNCAVPAKSFWE